MVLPPPGDHSTASKPTTYNSTTALLSGDATYTAQPCSHRHHPSPHPTVSESHHGLSDSMVGWRGDVRAEHRYPALVWGPADQISSHTDWRRGLRIPSIPRSTVARPCWPRVGRRRRVRRPKTVGGWLWRGRNGGVGVASDVELWGRRCGKVVGRSVKWPVRSTVYLWRRRYGSVRERMLAQLRLCSDRVEGLFFGVRVWRWF